MPVHWKPIPVMKPGFSLWEFHFPQGKTLFSLQGWVCSVFTGIFSVCKNLHSICYFFLNLRMFPKNKTEIIWLILPLVSKMSEIKNKNTLFYQIAPNQNNMPFYLIFDLTHFGSWDRTRQIFSFIFERIEGKKKNALEIFRMFLCSKSVIMLILLCTLHSTHISIHSFNTMC